MKWCRSIAALYLACSTASGTTSHSDHDHSDHEDHGSDSEGHFEAAAVYAIEAGTNSIVAVPGEDVREGTFAFMLVPAASADLEGLEGAEEVASQGRWQFFLFLFVCTGPTITIRS